MPDHKPHPDPNPGHTHEREKCAVHLQGYIECCCPVPEKMCNKYLHLPCAIEGEDIIQKIMQFQNVPANANYNVVQVLDHGHDGWTVIFEGPCCD